ncbi:flagellar FliL protein [Oikeobacillus pervagus]|uniref:Flagellar protein FliL n=1 Tax=Oikeobacillus pervagus TaxID=1325931 RepID=A0AAJ1SX87_9BACI|nr:flagellar basal body-associated protein FliL [Oikeobacillus pervagus]MDQ0214294.1 flagellar FliL protein [Oikeobacillus pervagus]
MENEKQKNKILSVMLILLTVITLVGAVVIIMILKSSNTGIAKEPKIDEVLEASVDVPELTTNLATNDYIRISFKIETESKEAKKELEKRDFQTKNIIIKELSELKSDDLKGKEGKDRLCDQLKMKLNEVMQEGKVINVYITSYIIQ